LGHAGHDGQASAKIARGAFTRGEGVSSTANGAWLGGMTNGTPWSLTNQPAVGSEDGLLLQIGVGSAPGVASLAKLDLRPSVWDASFASAAAVIKDLGIAMMYGLFFIVVRKELNEKILVYYTAMSGAGKSLTGATLAGAAASVSIRFAIASAVTTIIALLPAATIGFLETGGFGLVNMIDTAISGSTATGNAGLISGTARAAVLVDRFISYPTLMACIVNYYAVQVMEAGLMAVGLAVYRFLPLVLAFAALGYSGNVGAAQIVVDNRLSQPLEVVTDRGIESFQPGEREVDMSENFFVTSVQGTNGLTFSLSSGRARLIVVASAMTNNISGFLEGETPRQEFVMQGFVVATSIGGMVLLLAFARRIMKMAFGGYRED